MSTPTWIDTRGAGIPPALRDRIRQAIQDVQACPDVQAVPPAEIPEDTTMAAGQAGAEDPRVLADAALDRLGRVLASSGDRGSALDLLAADALLTHACAVAARAGPEELAGFAESLLARIAGVVPEAGGARGNGPATAEDG